MDHANSFTGTRSVKKAVSSVVVLAHLPRCLLDDEHGALGLVDDALGRIAQQNPLQTRATTTADNDQIRVFFVCGLDDHFVWPAERDGALHPTSFLIQEGNEPVHERPC